jgi:dihydrofolate reductase
MRVRADELAPRIRRQARSSTTIYQRADAFLFGRRTYEIFGSWGTWDDPGDSPIWTALNMRPKYVASTTPIDPKWAGTTVLSGDVAAAIGELKAEAGSTSTGPPGA